MPKGSNRNSVALALSKSGQVQQYASQKLQKKLQSSMLLQRSDQSPRLKGFKGLSDLVLRDATDASQALRGRTRGSGEGQPKKWLQSSPTGTEPPPKIIKPKSFHKIQQEKMREFGAADHINVMTQNADDL